MNLMRARVMVFWRPQFLMSTASPPLSPFLCLFQLNTSFGLRLTCSFRTSLTPLRIAASYLLFHCFLVYCIISPTMLALAKLSCELPLSSCSSLRPRHVNSDPYSLFCFYLAQTFPSPCPQNFFLRSCSRSWCSCPLLPSSTPPFLKCAPCFPISLLPASLFCSRHIFFVSSLVPPPSRRLPPVLFSFTLSFLFIFEFQTKSSV